MDNLWFDEVLDGLDSDMKLKAFRLFQELSLTHSSIVLIDHCQEFQNLFDKKLQVELVQDHSVVTEVQ